MTHDPAGASAHPPAVPANQIRSGFIKSTWLIDLRVALSFLTILPVGPRTLPSALAPARAYFPLVGLLLGAGVAGLDAGLRRIVGDPLPSIVAVASLVVATRGLHVDGLMDCCDALFGGRTMERRLEILKDPHAGAFGVIGVVLLVALLWGAMESMEAPWRTWTLLAAPCLSRWGMVLAMESEPYARREGLGAAFREGRSVTQVGLALVTAAVVGVLLDGWAGLAMLAAVTLVSLAAARWMSRLLGGLTGDCYGAINELGMLACLLLAAILQSEAASLFAAPLPTGV